MIKQKIPYNSKVDETVELLLEGYLFIKNRKEKHKADIFYTRLMGRKVICMTGEEGAKLFYNNDFFKRRGAASYRIQQSLFGVNAIQTMDGEAHQHRKKLFMSFMIDKKIDQLKALMKKHWLNHMDSVSSLGQVHLFDEVQQILCKAACEWANIPLRDEEVKDRANDLGKLVDAFGAVGPRHWQGRTARNRTEQWLMTMIEQVRSGKLDIPKNSILYVFSNHKDYENELLDVRMAATEIINILRPIVAIATYITFCAHALYNYPNSKGRIQNNKLNFLQMFVQEVRRFYPFGPYLGAIVKKKFMYNDIIFTRGQLVLLDLYGTNHDERIWDEPNKFNPNRFENWVDNHYQLIPQGGGNYDIHHRCAGEQLTIEIMKTATELLVKHMTYTVPEQDLSVSLRRMPTLPEDRFIIENISVKKNLQM